MHLVELHELEELEIDAPRVTLAGVRRLARLPSLMQLTLRRTSLSQADVAVLRQQMPACKIVDRNGRYLPGQ